MRYLIFINILLINCGFPTHYDICLEIETDMLLYDLGNLVEIQTDFFNPSNMEWEGEVKILYWNGKNDIIILYNEYTKIFAYSGILVTIYHDPPLDVEIIKYYAQTNGNCRKEYYGHK
jgi:hypothetical protein